MALTNTGQTLRQPAPGAAQPAPESVHEMVELEQREKIKMTFSDHVADAISSFAGSMLYVWLHVIWFTIWIVVNLPGSPARFDGFPFGLLTMIVSLEAIFLSTFVMISQNSQARLSDKRTKLDLQVNLIAEQEVTKMVSMLAAIQKQLGIVDPERDDPEVQQMERPTHVHELAEQMEQEEEAIDAAAGKEKEPSSAADTEA